MHSLNEPPGSTEHHTPDPDPDPRQGHSLLDEPNAFNPFKVGILRPENGIVRPCRGEDHPEESTRFIGGPSPAGHPF